MSAVAACPACGAAAHTAARRPHAAATLCRCAACGLRYSDPMQHPGRDWYERSAVYAEVEWNLVPVERLAERWEFQRFLAQNFTAGAFVFDVGCGRGDFLALVQARGFVPGGADLNRNLLDVAARHFGLRDLVAQPIEEIERLPRAPDVITAFEVVEHLPDPAAFLRACRRLLAPGGAVVLTVPGLRRWPPLLHRTVDYPPHHLTLWTEAALQALLERTGFRVRAIERKPLLVSDLMYHAARAVPGALRPGRAARVVRGVCKLGCAAAAPALRLHPRAGGFTLVAVGTT